MKRLCYISILLLLIFRTAVAADGGFLGKKHQLSFDVLAPILSGEYGLNYKITMSRNFALNINYNRLYNKGKITQNNYPFDFIPIDFYSNQIGSFTVRGTIVGYNMIFSNGETGMPLPLGYYFGLGYDSWIIRYTESLYSQDPPFDKYSNYGCRYTFIWGKDTYIAKNITIDIFAEIGLKWGKVYNTRLGNNSEPAGIRPYRQLIFSKVTSLGSNFTVTKYRGIFSGLNVRIGWLF